jgi:transposase
VFVLRTGIPWEYMPAEMGVCGMTCWRRLRDWQAAGVWAALHRVLLEHLHDADRLDWRRASLDSAAVPVNRGARRPARTQRIAARRAASGTSSWTPRAHRSAWR